MFFLSRFRAFPRSHKCPDSIWFYILCSMFGIFRVFRFFRQKSPKDDAKTQCKQIIEKSWSGHPFREPKSMKIEAGQPAKRPNCEKMLFLEGTVFWSFFRCIFRWILGPPDVPGGLPKSTFLHLFPTFLRACRFRAAPDRFLVDFWSIFGWFFWSFFCRFLIDF